MFSHEEYINLVLQDGHVMSHDYSHESTDEDPRMMAFFDSLVQRELEGWSSDDSLSSNEEELFSRIVQLSQSDIDTDDSLEEPSLRDSDDDTNFSPFTIAFASVMASQAAEGNDRFPRLNAALGNAERGTSTQDSSDDQRDEEPPEDQSASEASRRRDISEMVKKKKKELKDTLQRRLRDCKATVSSSSESDLSDSDVEDMRKLPPKVERKSQDTGGSDHKNQEEILKKRAECKKQAQLKIRRLRNLKQSILNSDSEASDVEIGEKQITLNMPSATSLSNTDTSTGKVQFKKLNKGFSDNKTAEGKDYLKSRGSPDRGPYLQKKNINTNLEARSSILEENKHKKGKSSTSESHKGKRLKSDSKHKTSSVNFATCRKDKQTPFQGRCQRRTKSAEYEQLESERKCDLSDLKPIPEKTCTVSKETDASENKRTRSDDENNICAYKKLKPSNETKGTERKEQSDKSKDVDVDQPSCSYGKGLRRTGSVDAGPSRSSKCSDVVLQCGSGSSSEEEEEAQPTWMEFKRFKNKLERARRHYREHKHHKTTKRHYSDDDA